MKWLLLLGAVALPAPAIAQQHDHQSPATGEQVQPQADPHASHQMPDEADPHAGHEMPVEADAHSGHLMPAQETDPHAGHDAAEAVAQPPLVPPPPEALSGPENAADSVWGNGSMAEARRRLGRDHGGMPADRLLVDRLEASTHRGNTGYAVDGEAWYGGDIDKLWLKGESQGQFGSGFEGLETQALWSHAIGPWFDLQTGVRYDFQRGPDRAHLVIGVQGVAPYRIEVDGAVFISQKGDVTAKLEAEHDVRITQKLILQPRAELGFALQKVPEAAIGSGLSDVELGLRLRYQLAPQFAPYVGISWSRAFGGTARMRRYAGDDPSALSLLGGIRFWF
ncbi:MAG: copper resistance protein B [Sphingomicrobium sp.]